MPPQPDPLPIQPADRSRAWPALRWVLFVSLFIALSGQAADTAPAARSPLKGLFIAGGGFHDYEKLVPYLTQQLSELINVTFESKLSLDVLNDPHFADKFDLVVYDMCDERAPDAAVENALQATRAGKPTVMIHCALHAFRYSPSLKDWETCCGMRSKSHDPFATFVITRVDPASPITKSFPDTWKTPGDELYQTISIDPQSRPLLKATSVKDGREHVVCWTYQYGRGRVFATTLGHDMKTTSAPEFLRLLANGFLWACGKLEPNGAAAPGYAGPAVK